MNGEEAQFYKSPHRVYKLFKGGAEIYLYDTATNQILRINEHLATGIKQGDSDIIRAMQRKFGVLKPFHHKKALLPLSLNDGDWTKSYERDLKYLIIELTEDCNMACEYCIMGSHYQFSKKHSLKNISKENAFSAINLFISNLSGISTESPCIAFYGGEPLLRFDLLKQCVSFAKRKFLELGLSSEKQLQFHLITNGLLLHKYYSYLREEKFGVEISLDGPRDIHDNYRRDKAGNGTFARIYEFLHGIGPDEYFNRVSFQCVLTPDLDLRQIRKFFLSNFPTNVVSMTPVEGYLTDFFERYRNKPNLLRQFFVNYNLLFKDFINSMRRGVGIELFDCRVFDNTLRRIHSRELSHMKQPVHYGMCLPGVQMLFVDVEGNLHPCEKISSACIIGSAKHGFNFNKIVNLLEIFERLIHEIGCHHCWAIRLCRTCFVALRAFQNTEESWKYTIRKQKELCFSTRKSIARNLKYYTQIMEDNPEILDEIFEKQTYKGGSSWQGS